MKKGKPEREKGSPHHVVQAEGRKGWGRGEKGMSDMGDAVVSLKVREEKGKCKKRPTGLEEGETGREELGDEVSLER